MRLSIAFVTAAGLLAPPTARACDRVVTRCPPAVVAFPAYSAEGIRVGTVEARVRPPQALEISRFTGQPLSVVYNDPNSRPGLVDPEVVLQPLPRAPRFHTRAVYPGGD